VTPNVPAKPSKSMFRYRRRFVLPGGCSGEVVIRSTMNGLISELRLGGELLASDATPAMGEEAARNHHLTADTPQGRVEVEAGYLSWWNVGIAVRLDGRLVHESHPGRRIAMPESARKMALSFGGKDGSSYDSEVWKRNRVPLGVDIGTGLLFYAVAKLTDLTTAALVGAGVGVALYIIQRRTRVDLLGGLAMFGIVMLIFSAALALVFQSEDAVKMRTTIVGLVTAGIFLVDGLLLGGRLGKRLANYLPFSDLIPTRLAIGMGVLGLVMAGLNLVVARFTSTDLWLFYTTFGDIALTLVLIMVVFSYARGRLWPPRRV
jgi:intracellular septation protein A